MTLNDPDTEGRVPFLRPSLSAVALAKGDACSAGQGLCLFLLLWSLASFSRSFGSFGALVSGLRILAPRIWKRGGVHPVNPVHPVKFFPRICKNPQNPGHFLGRLAAFRHFSQNYFCVQVFGNSHFQRKTLHTSHFRQTQKSELLPTVGRNFLKSVI